MHITGAEADELHNLTYYTAMLNAQYPVIRSDTREPTSHTPCSTPRTLYSKLNTLQYPRCFILHRTPYPVPRSLYAILCAYASLRLYITNAMRICTITYRLSTRPCVHRSPTCVRWRSRLEERERWFQQLRNQGHTPFFGPGSSGQLPGQTAEAPAGGSSVGRGETPNSAPNGAPYCRIGVSRPVESLGMAGSDGTSATNGSDIVAARLAAPEVLQHADSMVRHGMVWDLSRPLRNKTLYSVYFWQFSVEF